MSKKYKIEPEVSRDNLDVLATTATTSKHNTDAKPTPFMLEYPDASLENISESMVYVHI